VFAGQRDDHLVALDEVRVPPWGAKSTGELIDRPLDVVRRDGDLEDHNGRGLVERVLFPANDAPAERHRQEPSARLSAMTRPRQSAAARTGPPKAAASERLRPSLGVRRQQMRDGARAI
jgi:hypothetical protein